MKFKYSLGNYIKIFKARDNVTILDIKLHKNDFTQHGLHLNTVGKEKIAEMIVETIKQPGVKKMNILITIDEEGNPKDVWPELHETITHAQVNKISVSSTVPDEHHHLARTLNTPKRTPVTRHKDFLW
jgi:hypothetical protein